MTRTNSGLWPASPRSEHTQPPLLPLPQQQQQQRQRPRRPKPPPARPKRSTHARQQTRAVYNAPVAGSGHERYERLEPHLSNGAGGGGCGGGDGGGGFLPPTHFDSEETRAAESEALAAASKQHHRHVDGALTLDGDVGAMSSTQQRDAFAAGVRSELAAALGIAEAQLDGINISIEPQSAVSSDATPGAAVAAQDCDSGAETRRRAINSYGLSPRDERGQGGGGRPRARHEPRHRRHAGVKILGSASAAPTPRSARYGGGVAGLRAAAREQVAAGAAGADGVGELGETMRREAALLRAFDQAYAERPEWNHRRRAVESNWQRPLR
eukprot:SAG11_NODE_52_length_19809_cov_14.064231_14_plen_326_part_00